MTAGQYKCDIDLLSPNDSGISGQKRKWVLLHTDESVRIAYGVAWTAKRLAEYQQSPSAGGSYHVGIGRAGDTARINDDEFSPWATGNRNNFDAYHICLNGWARADRREWLSYAAQIEKTAQVIAHYCRKYSIPCRWVTGAEMARGIEGVADHNESRIAFGNTDHTDVGQNYPKDELIKRANQILSGTGAETNLIMEGFTVAQIDRLYHELTNLFGSRVEKSTYKDTTVGFALNTDASLFRSEQRLDRVAAKLELAKKIIKEGK